jgi:DNA-directed RNA polymerase III subunit RPC6
MSVVTVKQEQLDAADIDDRILLLCQQNVKGITEDILLADMPSLKGQPLADAINRLMKKGLLNILRNPQSQQLVYKVKPTAVATAADTSSCTTILKGASQQENLVYQIIQDAGNKGIWRKEIHRRSGNIPQQEFDKILKSLESKKLVKQVSSVQASRKKVYMLYNLQPDRSVTGGSWYTDQDFDSQFVDTLVMMCHRFLDQKAVVAKQKPEPLTQRNNSYCSSNELLKYITDSGITTHPLSIEDIESILDTLVYDGKVQVESRPIPDGSSQNFYCVVSRWSSPTGLSHVPCSMCPLIGECRVGSVVSPETCEFLSDWLGGST